jgi:tetrapyrrole methylase family protein/MazG family protein
MPPDIGGEDGHARRRDRQPGGSRQRQQHTGIGAPVRRPLWQIRRESWHDAPRAAALRSASERPCGEAPGARSRHSSRFAPFSGGSRVASLGCAARDPALLARRFGCPWDRKQTLADLCRYLIDESYELQDAAVAGDTAEAALELGDVLFVALSCGLLIEERGGEPLARVFELAREKIVRRHPHVFGDRTARDSEESLRHWEDVKAAEARARGEEPAPFLGRQPRSVPALRRAHALQRKVAEVGFEWETADQVWAKLPGRIARAARRAAARRPRTLAGRTRRSAVLRGQLGALPRRRSGSALDGTIAKFTQRFGYVERRLLATGRDLRSATLAEMDALWEESKRYDDGAGSGPPRTEA